MILDVRNDSVTLARDKAGKTNSHSAGSDVGDTGHVLGRGGKGNTPQDNKSFAAELWITYFALVATLLVISLLLRKLTGIYSNGLRSVNAWSVFEQSVFISLVLILIYGGIVYQLARIGYYKRLRAHRSVPRERVEAHFLEHPAPPVTILVPSYNEEPRTVEQTLLSAALQTYPNRRVVLLLDDPPFPKQSDGLGKLEAARAIPASIQAFLDHLALPFERERQEFGKRKDQGGLHAGSETEHLADLYEWAATWFQHKAAHYLSTDHTDTFFIDHILRAAARKYSRRAADLRSANPLDKPRLQLEYERLAALFRVGVTLFERKRYLNLSHEPNKAMNPNSYVGLTGRSFTVAEEPEGLLLREVSTHAPNVHFRVPELRRVAPEARQGVRRDCGGRP